MLKRMRRITVLVACAAALLCAFALGANAYTYPSMPSNWEDVQVTVGDVTMPLERYPSGSTYDPNKRYMTVEEQIDYGFNVGSDIDLRGWDCVGFARYVYTALFYKYPQDATIDISLAYSYGTSYAYVNMIEEVLGTRTLAAGYSADTLKTLITSCRPGAVMRVSGHSMVLMAIYDDGVIIYDDNFSLNDQVSVRAYTWDSFVNVFGSRGIEALQMPAYYPGYSYSIVSEESGEEEELNTEKAGTYSVTASALNVRSRNSTSAGILGSLSKGDTVEVLGTRGDWGMITFNGREGWVCMDYLESVITDVRVTFDPNGGKASFTDAVYTAGSAFQILPTASKDNRTLLHWTDGTDIYTEDSIVPETETLELTAEWGVLMYEDVSENAWYAPYVEWANTCGLISSADLFYPLDDATRAQMVTVLGREYEREIGGSVSLDSDIPFADVPEDAYYLPYVAWGYSTGIVKGTGDGSTFSPDDRVTREQIATFLYRLAVYTGCTVEQSGDASVLDRFSDGDQVSDFALSAICWAVEAGILEGNDLGCVNPLGYATRSEMITMFSRYVFYADEMQ